MTYNRRQRPTTGFASRRRLIAAAAITVTLAASERAEAVEPIGIVAAENFYGDVAGQIGGLFVTVISILSNPDEDPHLFEASPSVARSLSGARIVVYNGANYDAWMGKLLLATGNRKRQTVIASQLTGHKPGDNPHLWYDPSTMPAVARALATDLERDDPAHAAIYAENLQRFLQSLAQINTRITSLRARFAGQPATATEPVFGYMAAAIGLDMRNQRFQLAIMNDAEPAASDVAAMENDLRGHKVRLFIYNSQVSNTAATRLLAIAKAEKIAVLGVTETQPRSARSFQDWVLGQLDALDRALSGTPT